MSQHTTIFDLLEQYDNAYHNGDSLIEDIAYDQLKYKAQKENPNHPYFMQVGSDVRGGKIDLPYTMGSLDQIQKGEIHSWVNKYNLFDEYTENSYKLDGVSVMLQYNDRNLQIAYSRGNGVKGADITRHVKKIKNVPLTIDVDGHFTVRGEIIMPKNKFVDNWADTFKNPRNLVAGAMNRKVTDQDMLDDIDLILYQIVDGSSEFKTSSQREDLELLSKLGFTVVNSISVKGSTLTDDYLAKYLAKAKHDSIYELDGLVLTINKKSSQKTFSKSSSLNPEHSVKYKVLDSNSIVESTVVGVHWELSQHGFYKPRVEILPVPLFGTTVTFASGFNGRFIVDNNIGPGTILMITKGGSVIPDIVDIITPTEASLPTGGWHWNKTDTEIRVDDYDNHPSVIFKQVLQFFNTLDVELFKEASLKNIMERYNLINSNYETIIETIIGLLEPEWLKVIGTNGAKIYTSLQRRTSSMTLETYLGAVKYLGFGFGVRKAKALLRGLDNPNDVWSLTPSQIVDIEGFDTMASTIVDGLPKAKALLESLAIQTIQEEKTDELIAFNIVFTGFRDKEFQEKLEKAGAKVGSGVSKKTTHVLTAEPNSTSTKAKKARELGILTMSLNEFKDTYNL